MGSQFDPILVFSSRLEIVARLANGQPLSFTELSKATGLADGNLHVQTRKLLEAGYLSQAQAKGPGRGRTLYQITERGERRLRLLIAALEQSLERPTGPRARPVPAPAAADGRESRPAKDDSQVW